VSPTGAPTPGRVSVDARSGLRYQHEAEYGPLCEERAANGFNSGMGEIFRRVAQISEVEVGVGRPSQELAGAGAVPPLGERSEGVRAAAEEGRETTEEERDVATASACGAP